MTRLGAAVLIATLAFVLVPVVRAEDEPPTVNEQAKDYAKEFKRNYKKMSEAEQLEALDKLTTYFNDEAVDDDKVKGDIIEAMTKGCTVRDPIVVAHLMKQFSELKMDERQSAEVGRIIAKVLDRELKQKVPNDTVYEAAFDALGKLHVEDRTVIKQLTDLLNHKDYPVIARAARAIAGYAGASGEVRKELFEEVLKSSEGTYSASQNNDTNMKRKWNVIEDDVMDALVKLTNVTFDNPIQARSWWGDHKKENWDREEK